MQAWRSIPWLLLKRLVQCLVMNKWRPICVISCVTWISGLKVQTVIVLSSIDEWLIQAHEYSRTPHFWILNPRLSILASWFLHLETWTSLPWRSENWVSRIASRLSTYLLVVLYTTDSSNYKQNSFSYRNFSHTSDKYIKFSYSGLSYKKTTWNFYSGFVCYC